LLSKYTMKITKLFAIAFSLVLFAGVSHAQTKTAFIDYTELMTKLPEVDSVQAKLKKMQATYEKTLTAIEKELNSKQKYWQDVPPEDATISELRTQEYQSLVNRYQTIEQEASKALNDKQVELLEPIIEHVKEVIATVAKAKGYTYVLDSSDGGSVLYGDPSHDLMEAVKTKLTTK